MRQLQQQISSLEFAELLAFRLRNTWAPHIWLPVARLACQLAAHHGIDLDVEQWIGSSKYDPEAVARAKLEAADKYLNRQA